MIARFPRLTPGVAAFTAAGLVLAVAVAARMEPAQALAATAQASDSVTPIVGLRRLSEAQYRNSIADIFGADIKVAGRFEPIVRPAHELLETGSATASISPTGLEQFDAIGRSIAAQVFDEKHRDLFAPCAPADATKADAACAASVLTRHGRYLFRRPLTAREEAFYTGIANDGAGKSGGFYKGLELALSAMLVSPNFLYVVETAEADPAAPGKQRLDNYSRASRLSFLLWNTTPNETLLAAAEKGALTDPAQLAAVAETMVKSRRVEAGARAFFADMLMFERFDELAKDPVVFPRFNPEVSAALPEQMLRTIVDHLVTRDGDYRELFTTRRTFVNRALGPIYDVRVAASQGWLPYEIPADDERSGLLGQAGFLAMYSHSGRSSPTLRGRAIRELLMCQPVPNPPGNVNFTAVQDVHNRATPTARSRLDLHTNDPVCAACHKITDPIGLPLERFDGVGAFRLSENDAPIDASGSLDGTSFNSADGLNKALAANPAVTQCVARRGVEYAIGHSAEEREDLVTSVEEKFAADGYRFRRLLLLLATMPEFYRVEQPALLAPAPVAARAGASSRSGR